LVLRDGAAAAPAVAAADDEEEDDDETADELDVAVALRLEK